MNIIAINLTLIEVIALPLVAIILGVTIYFFLKSRESLKSLQNNKQNFTVTPREKPVSYSRSTLADLEEQYARRRQENAVREEYVAPVKKQIFTEENIVQEMKHTIAQQQRMLDTYLGKVEEVEQKGREEILKRSEALEKEINKLHGIIENKDAEIEVLEQESQAAKRMAEKIEEVYQEFDQLQSKMATLEKQASRSYSLAMELEDTRTSYEQVHNELIRKQEKMEEVLNENQKMRLEINMLEDKLSESNSQRQQLQKKLQFLQELNADMQSISETNKKLQTELRRIGELESMLNMMAEERDFLLRKKSENFNRPGL